MASLAPASSHGALMDGIYRRQKHIYDATRKFYLFGRDGLIDGLDARSGAKVLEIACGTGRNLDRIAQVWPGVRLHGLDISSEMLSIAQKRLPQDCKLACGDATDFDAQRLFGQSTFDRIVISYAVSMIPQWEATLEHACRLLAPDGSLHVVDFGDCNGLPKPFRAGLMAWLRAFHVTPRATFLSLMSSLASEYGLAIRTRRGRYGYFRRVTLFR
jgi:S-adenosylmethionine-diacylgycerolhomoserine-N-methlytransferase